MLTLINNQVETPSINPVVIGADGREIYTSGSFVQDQRHASKTDRFVPVKPEQLRQALESYGFEMIHLKTARARQADKINHQTTIARYRSRDAFEIDGHYLDIIVKAPHLYGKIQLILGLFRGVCSNQINVGEKFETIRVAHRKNPIEDLMNAIPQVLKQREQLIEMVRRMQSTRVTEVQAKEFARIVAQHKIEGARRKDNIKDVQASALLFVNREEDREPTLWNVFNTIQENVIRKGIVYTKTSKKGIDRLNITRALHDNSEGALKLNSFLWDVASEMVTQAA